MTDKKPAVAINGKLITGEQREDAGTPATGAPGFNANRNRAPWDGSSQPGRISRAPNDYSSGLDVNADRLSSDRGRLQETPWPAYTSQTDATRLKGRSKEE